VTVRQLAVDEDRRGKSTPTFVRTRATIQAIATAEGEQLVVAVVALVAIQIIHALIATDDIVATQAVNLAVAAQTGDDVVALRADDRVFPSRTDNAG
jgi:hypothetical protein